MELCMQTRSAQDEEAEKIITWQPIVHSHTCSYLHAAKRSRVLLTSQFLPVPYTWRWPMMPRLPWYADVTVQNIHHGVTVTEHSTA